VKKQNLWTVSACFDHTVLWRFCYLQCSSLTPACTKTWLPLENAKLVLT